MLTRSGTIDAGRGCPFNCSFCTIVNVQGHAMRARGSAPILAQIRDNYDLADGKGIHHYFFTDDNFTRNPHWEEIFDGLIRMHEVEGKNIDFMMQVDAQAPRVPRFIEKAARAGCVQVFIGMETIRDDNLKAGGKQQNKTADYRDMIAAWHAVGGVCHVGYIIGFPNDTYERVMQDVRALRDTLLVDQASFFMLTPLPGSRDHQMAMKAGVPLDPDYNNLITGFIRLKDRQSRRPGFPIESRWTFFRRRVREHAYIAREYVKIILEMQELWLKTRIRGEEYVFLGDLRQLARRSTQELKINWGRVHAAIDERLVRLRASINTRTPVVSATLAERLDAVRDAVGGRATVSKGSVDERARAARSTIERLLSHAGTSLTPDRTALRRVVARLNIFSLQRLEARRDHVKEYWQHVWHAAGRLEFWRLNPLVLSWNLARDTRHALLFFYAMLFERY